MNMGQKLKIVGWLSVGALAGALTTISLQTTARGSFAPLPLEELQQLAAVFGMVDPDDIRWFGQHMTLSRQGVYTVSFFVFWCLTMVSSSLTLLLSISPLAMNRGSEL